MNYENDLGDALTKRDLYLVGTALRRYRDDLDDLIATELARGGDPAHIRKALADVEDLIARTDRAEGFR